jgi:hypothetical protein
MAKVVGLSSALFFGRATDFCASAIFDGKHEKLLFSNPVDYPIVTFANPIEMV